ncbi:MAG: MYXO-CTERM domain-containing protein, partial [Cognaticolwellia sp.]
WELITDGGKELAGWTLDDVAVLRLAGDQDNNPDGSDPIVSTTITAAGSCGCSSTAPNSGMLIGFLAVLGGVLLRRRRS